MATHAIEHKGYHAEVEIDFEDNCIYASVGNAPGLYLIAEGETPEAVQVAFKNIIDDYLKSAQARNWKIIEPATQEVASSPSTNHSPKQKSATSSRKNSNLITRVRHMSALSTQSGLKSNRQVMSSNISKRKTPRVRRTSKARYTVGQGRRPTP